MKAVKVRADGSIKLPADILRTFPPASELAVSWEGDTITLQRLTARKPSRAKKPVGGKQMSMEDVSEEIHEIRREKRSRLT
jgi:hypothetical protein